MDKDCWFCYSNQIDRHLIFYESENFYCALPKGPVVEEHFLIVPKQHIPNQIQIFNDPELSQEFENMKTMLLKYLKETDKNYFIFERFIPFKFEKA